MSCEVATLPFQTQTNYGIWSIDFGVFTLLFIADTISKFYKIFFRGYLSLSLLINSTKDMIRLCPSLEMQNL